MLYDGGIAEGWSDRPGHAGGRMEGHDMSTNRLFALMDPTTLMAASENSLTKATDREAVKRERTKAVDAVRATLRDIDTPEGFASVVADVAATYTLEVERIAIVSGAVSRIGGAVKAVVIREAWKRDLIGSGRLYPTGAALSKALGCSSALVSQNRPAGTKDATKAAAGAKGGQTKADNALAEAVAADPVAAGEATMIALAKTVAVLERQTKALVVTDANREDAQRLANALVTIGQHLATTAKAPVAV